MRDEIWKPVEGFGGLYEVSNKGRIKSLWFGKERILRPSTSKSGHLRLVLYSGGEKFYKTVHRAVAEAFLPKPDEGRIVCHRNGNPSDNREENLYWGTYSSNMYDKRKHGTDHEVNKTHCPRGHLLQEPNLQQAKWEKGIRGCRACHQAYSYRFNGHPGSLQELSDKRYQEIMNLDK